MRRFNMVDVFSQQPYGGNPLAVVLDGDGLELGEMLAMTRWVDLSETAFLCPPSDPAADYRVRIFTPAGELPFAGHPTLGACHAWLEAGGIPAAEDLVVQQCGAGLVPVRLTDQGPAFAAPPLVRSGAVEDADLDRVVTTLGITRDDVVDAAWTDNGPGWVSVRLASAEAVLALRPAASVDSAIDIGVVGLHDEGADTAVEIRAFFTDQHLNLREDPVTGSLNAGLAQWLLAAEVLQAPYVASQGTRLGRQGRPVITQDADGTIWVGGPTTTHVTGTIAG